MIAQLLLLSALASDGPVVEIDAPNAWPGGRRARIAGDPPLRGYPDREEVPHLVVDCTRRKLTVYVETTLPPDSQGDHYDGWRARAHLRYDLGPSESVLLRTDLGEDQLHFTRPRAFLRRLIAYQELEFQFTPFASAPTFSSFRVAELEQALGDIAAACRL